ncbi:MAG: hypothetical protein Q4E52_00065 [Fibrobacter sp.]|nr:hypothetical protein [Fibrobacter sp.]
MNKKIIAGLMSAAAVGTFWACGSGNIYEADSDDQVISATFVSPSKTDAENDSMVVSGLIKVSKEKCQADPECAAAYVPYLSGQEVVAPASSASEVPNNGNQPLVDISSSSRVIGGNPVSSATINTGTDPVASSTSGGGSTITGLGTCAESTGKTSITKGESVRFKVTPNGAALPDPMAIVSATYEWHYNSGTPDGSGDGKKTSDNITFTESGDADVSVTIYAGGESETIPCPLHINGDPITGCECTTAATTVDYTATPEVAWTVGGCTSGTHALSYYWDNAEGTTTFAKTFAEAQPGFAPKLVVKSDDNSLVEVTCPAVKTTKGAEYEIKIVGNQIPQAKVEVANGGCLTVTGEWTEANYLPSLKVVCDLKGQGVSLTITHGTETASDEGQYGVNNVSLGLGKIGVGAINIDMICIDYTAAGFGATDPGKAECGLGTN